GLGFEVGVKVMSDRGRSVGSCVGIGCRARPGVGLWSRDRVSGVRSGSGVGVEIEVGVGSRVVGRESGGGSGVQVSGVKLGSGRVSGKVEGIQNRVESWV
ncbi:hypothetical protein HAX54_006749, partial [Datura stramonium]|nr:hypothetical protein [Datura stramonium]